MGGSGAIERAWHKLGSQWRYWDRNGHRDLKAGGMATAEQDEIVPEPRGEGGGLFSDPAKLHEDAKLVSVAINRKWGGVVDPEKVKPLIEKGYDLASTSASEGNERGYAAVMRVIQGFAKLEQDELKTEQPTGNTTNVQINGNVSLNDGRTELLDIIAAASERAREAESSGPPDAPAEP